MGSGCVADMDFEAIEMAARREALKVAAKAIEQRFNADKSDHCVPGVLCECKKMARYAGRKDKTITTALAEMTLSRAYYVCETCKRGFFPRDKVLGLDNNAYSPAAMRMIGLVGAMVSFKEGSELLLELGGISVNAKQTERKAEELGREIAVDEQQFFEPDPEEAHPDVMYLGLDGTGIPMREEELQGRVGKQPDGSAKTREVKLCVVFTANERDKEGNAVRDEGSVSYSAAIESAAQNDTKEEFSDFAKRVERETKRRKFDQAKCQVVLADGASWIRNIANEQFPHAIQILDRFHANQHLFEVGKAVYGKNTDLAHHFGKVCADKLEKGDIAGVISAISEHASHSDVARDCVTYLNNNRDRMRYPEFKAMGLCTSSGVVEAGCKVTIGARLKRAGMHWTLRGANAIIALRCAKLSAGRLEDFYERRTLAMKAVA